MEKLDMRIDKELKAQFKELCKKNHVSMSQALIRYIIKSIEKGKL